MSTAPVERKLPPLREVMAEEVRVLLARRRMTGSSLALAIGRSQSYVSRRLTGEIAFDLDDLDSIATALGVEVSDLIPRASRTAAGGNTLRNPQGHQRLNPIVSIPAADQPPAVKDRPTPAASRPPRGPRGGHTTPGNRRPAVLPRPAAA